MVSKDTILKHCSEDDIYLKFLNLLEIPKKNISSPFSEDKKPSFVFYIDNQKRKWQCNSSVKGGDAFQLVADLNKLDCKTQFSEVLDLIANEMNIDLQNAVNSNIVQSKETQKHDKSSNKAGSSDLQIDNTSFANTVSGSEEKKKLSVTKREFRDIDIEYWEKLGVAKPLLEKYNVHSISSYTWTGKKPINIKNEALAFAFELQGELKLYIPEQTSIWVKKKVLPPFKTGVFGLEQLGTKKKEYIIICEGEKDVIVATSRGFNAVTFGSASKHLQSKQIAQLKNMCKQLLICYDNDTTGQNGMKKVIDEHPEIIALQLPDSSIANFDLTDYFQENSAEEFKKNIDLAVKNEAGKKDEASENTDLTIFHKAENYLSKHYDLRFDVIANEIEISTKDKNDWQELNEDALYVEMQKKHIKISKGNLSSILLSDFVPRFNPIKIYFESLPNWDKKTDHIKQFLDYVELEQGEDRAQFLLQFTKWCVRAVKCSINDGYYNKQAFVLSDDAKGQNIGKTTYLRYLVPKGLNKYYCENLPEDKDALKRLGQNFLINLDELATLSRTDINKLKSMFSSDKIKTRLPYGKKDIIIPRVANFIGSTNMSTFLVDESGSVRWLCFIVKKINFNYTVDFNIDNLWTQAYSLSKDETFKEVMTPEDIKQNELRNDKFQVLSPERELIPKYFEVATVLDSAEHLTSTAILNHICLHTANGIRLNAGAIGKALPKIGFIRQKHNGIYGYWVIKKPT